MDRKRIAFFFLVFVSVLLSFAFQQEEEEDALNLEKDPQVLARVDEKLAEYRVIRKRICDGKLLEQANEIVDSMLLEISRQIKQDTLLRPSRPDKPEKPLITLPKDSGGLNPLWDLDSLVEKEDRILKDSLKRINVAPSNN